MDIIKKKIIKQQLFNCSNLTTFLSSIINVISYSGYSGSRFFINKIDDYTFTTKLSFYTKDNPELYGVQDDKTINQVDAEIKILEILKKEILNKNISQCIINIIYYQKCYDSIKDKKFINYNECRSYKFYSDFKYLFYNMICSHKENVARGTDNDKIAFIAMEKGDITLRAFLSEYINGIDGFYIFKALLFEIIYTFYAIKSRFPSFKHNDLHTDNILLIFDKSFLYNPTNMKYISYTDGKTIWNVPYFGIKAKIIDFGFSVIEEKQIISNAVLNKAFSTRLLDNDILILLYDIYNNVISEDNIDNLIFELDPSYFYRTYDIDFTNKKNITYKQMIYNNTWADYKKKITPEQRFSSYGFEASIK